MGNKRGEGQVWIYRVPPAIPAVIVLEPKFTPIVPSSLLLPEILWEDIRGTEEL